MDTPPACRFCFRASESPTPSLRGGQRCITQFALAKLEAQGDPAARRRSAHGRGHGRGHDDGDDRVRGRDRGRDRANDRASDRARAHDLLKSVLGRRSQDNIGLVNYFLFVLFQLHSSTLTPSKRHKEL